MILFFRHGKTKWNKLGKLQGAENDSPLLEESFITANKIKSFIQNIKFDKFLISPLARAKTTFEYINPNVSESIYINELKEISFGNASGKKLSEIDPEFLAKRTENKWDISWPNGESYKNAYDRLDKVIELIDTENIGIMAHETINKILIGKISGWSPKEIFSLKQPNSVVYKIDNNILYYIDFSSQSSDRKWEIYNG